jgi:hypothetical protein
MAITSKNINLDQLNEELGSQGLIANFNDSEHKLILVADGSSVSEQELEVAISAHIAVNPNAAKNAAQEKLIALGLTINDLKALGL